MPNLKLFRPADAVEVAESWACALAETDSPSVLCLTRQGLPTIRARHRRENMVARGAYLLREPASPMGWDRWLGKRSSVIGMPGFGASAKAEDLYAHFGITAQAVRDEVRRLLQI